MVSWPITSLRMNGQPLNAEGVCVCPPRQPTTCIVDNPILSLPNIAFWEDARHQCNTYQWVASIANRDAECKTYAQGITSSFPIPLNIQPSDECCSRVFYVPRINNPISARYLGSHFPSQVTPISPPREMTPLSKVLDHKLLIG